MAEIDDTPTKRCAQCDQKKSLSAYHAHRGALDGRAYKCKVCTAANDKARHAAFRRDHPNVLKERRARNYLIHADQVKAYVAKYKKANRTKLRAANALNYALRKVEINAAILAWRQANPERVRSRQRLWQQTHRATVRASNIAWKATHPDELRRYCHTRRARKHRSEDRWTASDVRDIRRLQRDGCAACACPLKGKGHIDHIVALVNGGSNGRRNLQLLCQPCNNAKHVKDPIEFMQSRGFLL